MIATPHPNPLLGRRGEAKKLGSFGAAGVNSLTVRVPGFHFVLFVGKHPSPMLNAPIGFASGCGSLFMRSFSIYWRNSSPNISDRNALNGEADVRLAQRNRSAPRV
ncbi:MAG: hypothetical protein DME59_11775 [Verrucomicrobia bacterium]|nr:MAG: hypothetical protein DME59_11775 [Verrucomicrobiota bacterium]